MISSGLVLCAALLFASGGGMWANLNEDAHLCGRKASEGYLRDKVVLLCRWDATNVPAATLLRLEEVWEAFKMKSCVILGSPIMGAADTNTVRAAVQDAKVSYPVYAGAHPERKLARSTRFPVFYVLDETGGVLYSGLDDREATRALVQGLTDSDVPANAVQWAHYLDYEIKHLPAHAYNRFVEFRKANRAAAESYVSRMKKLAQMPSIKDVAKLVAFAKRAKDAPRFGPKERTKRAKYEALVTSTLESCKGLKDVADDRLRQEAKNALADLTWIQATF